MRKRIATTSAFGIWENDHYTVANEKASKPPLVLMALWKGLERLYLHQDGIKRGGVAQTGKFFCVEHVDNSHFG
jgi:hypothetical protein